MPTLLLSMGMILLAPWFPGDSPPTAPSDARPPVALVADASAPATPDGFDAAEAARRVVEGTALRLRSRGVAVQADEAGGFLIASGPSGPDGAAGRGALRLENAAPGQVVTLVVGFGASARRQAWGSETRFGGGGDAAWRLAAQVQRHLVGGLRDVLDYHSYDRGVVEQEENRPPAARAEGLQAGDPWVAAYPLFATNPREHGLLEWPETLDLLATALADALTGYLDPSVRTPPRTPEAGWRRSVPWQPVSPRVVWEAEGSPLLALTFDGGASSVPTPPILRALREAGVRATMFMTSDFVERNPDLVVEMARDGHEFGNHSSTHSDMTRLTAPAVVAELERLEAAVRALTGKSTRPWFRPPFGAYDDRLVRLAAEQGYYTIMWTADSADWREEVSAATVQRRLLAYASPGAILIEHLGSPQSAQVLAEVLRALKARDTRFGTLSDVLGPLD